MQSNNNTTTDSDASQQNQQQYSILALPEGLKVALYCLYCFIFLLGTLGNMLVIYIIGIKHRVERSCDVHIVSLAVADLLTAIVIPVVMIHDTKTNYMQWHLLGTFGCKLFVSMTHMTSIVSSLMLVTISLTRISVIYSSTAVSRRTCRSAIEVSIVWVVSFGIISPYMYHLQIVQETVCFDVWDPEPRFLYFTVVQSISCFMAVVVMVVVYSLSALRLYRNYMPGDDKVAEIRRTKQNRSVTRMFGGIVFLFFSLTTPYAVCFFVVAYYGTFDSSVYYAHEETFFYTTQLLYAVSAVNCCVNPFVYAKTHRNMKRTLSKQLSLHFRMRSNDEKSVTVDVATVRRRHNTMSFVSRGRSICTPQSPVRMSVGSPIPLPILTQNII